MDSISSNWSFFSVGRCYCFCCLGRNLVLWQMSDVVPFKNFYSNFVSIFIMPDKRSERG